MSRSLKRSFSQSGGSSDARAAKSMRQSGRKSTTAKVLRLLREHRPETKQLEGYVAATNLITSNVMLLNGVAVGDDKQSRDGRTILSKGVAFKMMIAPVATTTVPCYFAWAVVLDREAKGDATPGYNTIFDVSNIVDGVLAFNNTMTWNGRYKVLRKGTGVVCASNGGSRDASFIEQYVDLSKLPEIDRRVQYNSTGGNYASINKNAIYLCLTCSGQSTYSPSSNYAQYSIGTKYTFHDV